MKLIHLSDLHIGKRVNELSMLEDQEYILNRILQITEEQFNSFDLSIATIAKELGYHPKYLSHLFKSATGNSVMGYLQSCRIAEANKCLAQTDMRIGEIVEHCGFSDSSNFSRTFRAVTGLSPSEFRKQYYK